MAKQSGLGDLVIVAGVDVSGDVGSLGRIGGGPAALEVPGADVFAQERIGGVRDGAIDWSSWFNPARAHLTYNDLPTADVAVTYGRGRSQGSPGAVLIGKQIDYAGTRGQDGSLSFALNALANGYGLDWGRQITAGLRTDTTATSPATGLDLTDVSTLFGWQAYLQVTAFTGTSVTVTLQDSADNSAFANLTGAAFTAVSAAPAWQRLEGGRTATVRRYVRAITSGTFSNAVFNVVFARNYTAVSF
jgi:hypothetical protein